MDNLLKLPEVAERLGVSEKTVRRYVKAGVLPSRFIGNAYRVTESDIEEFLRASRVGPGGQRPKVERRSSELEPSLNDVLAEDERRTLADAYLLARNEAHKLLHLHRRRIVGQANRWMDESDKLTPEEVRRELGELAGYAASGRFEVRIPDGVDSLVDTEALDGADRFDMEVIGKAIKRLEEVAVEVIGRDGVDEVLREVEREAPEIEAELEADIPQAS